MNEQQKIGCVNHDCDKCKAVQEGRDWSLLEATQESLREHMAEIKRLKAAQPAPPPMHASGLVVIKTLLSRDPCAHAKVAIEMIDEMLAAEPQPVPVKTYHNGKPLPVAPKPWVGLTDEEREQHRDDWRSNIHDKEFRAIEAKLREKNTYNEQQQR